MLCIVNQEDPHKESVVFLYKMTDGRCPKSYGFNVATLAGLNGSIVAKGREVAQQLEKDVKYRNIFRKIFRSNDASEICALIMYLRSE